MQGTPESRTHSPGYSVPTRLRPAWALSASRRPSIVPASVRLMRERFARWLLVNLALALTLLGRPAGACDSPSVDEEALRAWAADTSLMSEERRVPGLKSAGEGVRASKSGPTSQPATLTPARPELVALIAVDELEPTPPPASRGLRQASAASARGPPAVAV